MTKRILIFSTAYLPFVGGAEIAVKELTDRIIDYEFDLITARLDRQLPKFEKIGRVNVYRAGYGSKFDKFLLPVLGLWRALRLNRRQKYGIIFSLMASQASIAAAFLKIFHHKQILVLNLQEGDEEEHLKRYVFDSDLLYNWLVRPWHLLVFKKADLIIAISEYLKSRALANGVKCPIEVVPNGVDAEKFKVKSSKWKVEELKRKLGISYNERVVITVSRLVEKNGIRDLIEAIRYMSEDVKLIIIGGGELETKFKLQIENLNLDNRVIMLGAIKNQEVLDYLAIADVFVRPSLSEGQGISFLEAMAAGVPVITTPVGGIVDFLRDGETGWFCEVKNPPSIAEKIKYVFDEKNKAKVWAVVNRAKAMVEKNYDWDLISARMRNIFYKINSLS